MPIKPDPKSKCPNCGGKPVAVKDLCWPCYKYQYRTGKLPNPENRRRYGERRIPMVVTLDPGMPAKVKKAARKANLTPSAWMRQAVRMRLNGTRVA